MRIQRLPGGIEAVEQRLIELEQELRSPGQSIRCPVCGSTDVEPVAALPARKGECISKFRCRACGGAVASG